MLKIVYGVEYIEVEFGQRPMGWKLFMDLEKCREIAKTDMSDQVPGGYIGPVRPGNIIEIPLECLDKKTKTLLKSKGAVWMPDDWSPPFEGHRHSL